MPSPGPHELLARLGGSARPAGSSAESSARKYCSDTLVADGFDVQELEFSYSAFPGLWGTPLIGAALVVTAIATETSILRGATAATATTVALVVVAILSTGAWWLGRFGTRCVPFLRRQGVNLEARRGTPRVWFIAHLDSKSQGVSLLTRAISSVAVLLLWCAVFAVTVLSTFAAIPGWLFTAFVIAAGIAAVPLAMAWTGSRGSGALDNASGVASIIVAAQRLGHETSIGLLITSAEELGMAGARAWVAGKPAAVAVNCDGIDDVGALTVTASGLGRTIVSELGRSSVIGPKVRIRKHLPGVYLDATAFSDSGWAACTVSRGGLGSLARIHTGRDCPGACSGAGVERAAELIALISGAIIAGGKEFAPIGGGSERK